MAATSRARILSSAAWGVAAVVFATLLLRHVSYPLLWQDEAETAVFAERILEYGYPKVHGPRNVVYEFGTNVALGIDESLDAYIGTTWGHFYFAVPGVLWARNSDDLYERTARVRLPFALTGALGVGLLLWAVAPVFARDRVRRRLFGAAFLLLCGLSISLVLHLREARYYPVLVAEIAAVIGVQLRWGVFGSWGPRRYALVMTTLLVGLFHTFFTSYFVVSGLLVLDAAWRFRGRGPGPDRRAALRSDALPLLVSGLLVAPALVYFETFQIAAEFSKRLGLTPEAFAANLGRALSHFSVYELLVPAVVTRLAVVLTSRGDASGGTARAVSARVFAFAVGYAIVTCANPLVYERYFVVLGPLWTLVVLLDGCVLVDRAAARVDRARIALVMGGVALAVVSVGPRLDALSGRLRELRVPVRGPLDFAIPWLQENFDDPASLVIATNYENHPYMYYLGSHVIVGFSRSNIVADRKLEPDVLVPRRRWRSTLGEIEAFRARGGYRSVPLEVRDVHYNNIPALSRSPSTPDPHRFETPRPERDADRLTLHVRSGG